METSVERLQRQLEWNLAEHVETHHVDDPAGTADGFRLILRDHKHHESQVLCSASF